VECNSIPLIMAASKVEFFTSREEDIMSRLKSLNVSKSAGVDNLRPTVLYELRTDSAFQFI
jgi:hypothetical protein